MFSILHSAASDTFGYQTGALRIYFATIPDCDPPALSLLATEEQLWSLHAVPPMYAALIFEEFAIKVLKSALEFDLVKT